MRDRETERKRDRERREGERERERERERDVYFPTHALFFITQSQHEDNKHVHLQQPNVTHLHTSRDLRLMVMYIIHRIACKCVSLA